MAKSIWQNCMECSKASFWQPMCSERPPQEQEDLAATLALLSSASFPRDSAITRQGRVSLVLDNDRGIHKINSGYGEPVQRWDVVMLLINLLTA